MIFIVLTLLSSLSFAEPGRITAGLSLGPAPGGLGARSTLDYGIARGIALTSEGGIAPGRGALGSGLLLLPVDSHWWRVGLVAIPELVWTEPLSATIRPDLAAHTGLRLSWLAFWGLSFTGRADIVVPRSGEPWTEIGGGMAVRM